MAEDKDVITSADEGEPKPKEDSGVGEVPGKPGRKKTPSGLQRAVKASKIKENAHWVALLGGLVPAVTASVISVMTAYRGEPEANRGYELLAPQVNNQKITLQIINSKLARIEGRMEGAVAGKLEAKLDLLMKENSALKAKMVGQPPTPAVKKPDPPPKAEATKCKAGHTIGEDKKCHRVKKTVAAAAKATQAKADDYKRRLQEKHEWLRKEKEKRRRLEQKVRMLKQQTAAKPAVPLLKAVPKSLKEDS